MFLFLRRGISGDLKDAVTDEDRRTTPDCRLYRFRKYGNFADGGREQSAARSGLGPVFGKGWWRRPGGPSSRSMPGAS